MTEESGPENSSPNKRGPRPFPVSSFADSLGLARAIHAHAAGDSMRRLTLFDKLGSKPESGHSRQLISNSSKYGLTTGSTSADYISITDDARKYLDEATSPADRLRIGFGLAIGRNDIFLKLYERLKDKRIPAADILRDELRQVGVSAEQRDQAGRIFVENVRQLGLVKELSGVERLVPIEQIIEEQAKAPRSVPPAAIETPPESPVANPDPNGNEVPNPPAPPTPSVHIDVQIHIDASATPEQIDQIFASMARHLYGREG